MVDVISFRGLKQSGKTTAANIVCSMFPKAVRLAFADPLKEELFDAILDDDDPYWDLAETLGLLRPIELADGLRYFGEISGQKTEAINCFKDILRPYLQTYGTEYRRNHKPYYWTEKFNTTASELIENDHIVVVDDCRFQNEREEIYLFDCLEFYVKNTELVAIVDEHSSENFNAAPDGVEDGVIYNTPSLGISAYTIEVMRAVVAHL